MDKRNKLQLYKDLEKESYIDLYRVYYENKREYLHDKNKKSEKLMKIIEFIVDNKDLDKKEKDIIQTVILKKMIVLFLVRKPEDSPIKYWINFQ